jgi:general stress protein CsbA
MTATATAGAFNDSSREERGPSWFSWLPGGKKPKQTNNYGAEATPNRMATYIGVALGVVLCGAALATGLSWLLLLAVVSPVGGVVIDKTTRQKKQDRAVQPEQTAEPEPEPEERQTSPFVEPDGFFKILEEQGFVLSEAQKKALQEKFPEGAPMEAWLEAAKPFFEPQQNSPSSSLSPEDKGSQLDEPVPVEPRPAEVEPSLLSATHELETDKPPAESTVTNQNQLGTLTDYHNINRQLSAENN